MVLGSAFTTQRLFSNLYSEAKGSIYVIFMDISRKYSTLSQVWKSFWVSELNVFAVYWVPGAPWRLKIPVSDLQNLLYFILKPHKFSVSEINSA